MLAFLGDDSRQLARVTAACAPGAELLLARDWHELEPLAATAECAVVWLEWLADEPAFAGLLALRARLPLQPIVLLTHRDADNARHLKDVQVEEVVWHDEPAPALRAAIARACARGVLSQVAGAFQESPDLAPPLRRALVTACRGAHPIHGVSGLSAAAGCDRRTLWRYWRVAAAGRTALTLQDVLDWLLLLRAIRRKTADTCWRAVAEELGVHEHTIARLAQRLGRRTLRELAALRVQGTLDAFRDEVLEPLGCPATAHPRAGGPRRIGARIG